MKYSINDEWLDEINGMDEDGRLSHEGKR